MQSRTLTWGESLKIAGYNLKYKALSFIDESASTQILPDFQQLNILGEKFTSNPTNHKLVNELIFKRYNTTIWMTYRSGFRQIKNKEGEGFVTDAGWGCMVRAGQMAMAQALKKHLRLTQKEELYDVIRLFDDFDEEAIFSIQNIVKVASKEYELEPGVWYNPCQITYITQQLFKTYPHNPFRKSLGLVVMNNSSLIFEQIIQQMTSKQQLCKCKRQFAICHKCDVKNVSVSVTILTRIGLDSPEPRYIRILNKIIECEYFQGFIGGKPGKALFLLGRHSDRYIYLDPHKAQPAVGKSNFEKQKQSYFCNNYRSCKNKDIDPSMGISFYLEGLEEVDKFYKYLSDIKKEDPEDFFIFMSLQTPDFMKPDYKIDESLFYMVDESGEHEITLDHSKQKQPEPKNETGTKNPKQ